MYESMYENSGSQFFRTTTRVQSGIDAFDESRFVMTFLTILCVTEILCSFRFVLQGKTGKEIYTQVIKIGVFRKIFTKQFCFIRYRREHFWTVKQRRDSRFTFNENNIGNLPKVLRAKFLGSDGLLFY